MNETCWELIYFDRFGWDSRRSTFYGWGKRGVKTYLKLYNDQIDMSFIWAISIFKFYGIMGIEETTTNQSVIKFLEKVWESPKKSKQLLHKKFIFVCDNASVNVSNNVSEFIERAGLRLLTIPSYLPQWILQKR